MSDVCKAYPELPPEIVDYIEVLEGSNKLMAADYKRLETENAKLKQVKAETVGSDELFRVMLDQMPQDYLNCQHNPEELTMKLQFTNDWLRKQIEKDPDVDCEAGIPLRDTSPLERFVQEEAQLADAVAENAKLRQALEEIASESDNYELEEPALAAVINIAKAALREE